MSIKNKYKIIYNNNIINKDCEYIVKKWHYSKSIRAQQQKHVFSLMCVDTNKTIGVAIYGKPINRHENATDALELRRLALIDETPKNTESFFLAKTLKWLEKNTKYTHVLTYADPNQGHRGTIYKASNFEFDGLETNKYSKGFIIDKNPVHLRSIYAKNKNGEYTRTALMYQFLIAIGEARIKNLKQKYRFKYYFRK